MKRGSPVRAHVIDTSRLNRVAIPASFMYPVVRPNRDRGRYQEQKTSPCRTPYTRLQPFRVKQIKKVVADNYCWTSHSIGIMSKSDPLEVPCLAIGTLVFISRFGSGPSRHHSTAVDTLTNK